MERRSLSPAMPPRSRNSSIGRSMFKILPSQLMPRRLHRPSPRPSEYLRRYSAGTDRDIRPSRSFHGGGCLFLPCLLGLCFFCSPALCFTSPLRRPRHVSLHSILGGTGSFFNPSKPRLRLDSLLEILSNLNESVILCGAVAGAKPLACCFDSAPACCNVFRVGM